MRNILMLSWANIRKHKGQSVSLLLFVLIAAMLFNVGLVIFLQSGSFFDERAERSHRADFTVGYVDGTDSIEKGLRFMQDYPGVTEIETLPTLGGYAEYRIGDGGSFTIAFLSRVSEKQKMDAPSLVGNSEPLTGDGIYIPYFMFAQNGAKIGDAFTIILSGEELDFTISGTTEEIMLGAQMNSLHRFYIPDDRYAEIEKAFPDYGVTLLSARLENPDDAVFFEADYDKEIPTDGLLVKMIYDNAKQSRTIVSTIAGIVITVFALILLAVSLIVIHFRIVNSIEEGMTNIGVLKAAGYRDGQIILSIALQFGGVALVGGILGVALAQVAIPIIMGLFEPMIALVWESSFDTTLAAVSLLAVLFSVLLIAFASSSRIRRLHPLIALRGGLTTHSFKKNHLPLDKARGSLNFLLATKQNLQNKKQAFSITMILALVTLASVAGLAVNYNMNDENGQFARSFFGELPEVVFVLKLDADGEAFKQSMAAYPDVRKVFGYQIEVPRLLIDEVSISTTTVESFDLLEGNMLIEGRYPKHNNEITIGTAVSRVTGKGVGDTVAARLDDKEEEYLVTGIVQFFNQNGFNGIISGDALRRLQPDFEFGGYAVYLNDGADSKFFLEAVQNDYGAYIESVMDIGGEVESMMGTMGGIFAAVAVGILGVTLFVIVLTLYMLIKTAILRRRREFGIQKAVGFTTFQLMNQIAQSMTPSILIGVIIGAALGSFGFNPMMTAFMGGMGIVKVEMPIPLGQTVAVGLMLVAVAYAVSMLIAWRIRKISAYALVSE